MAEWIADTIIEGVDGSGEKLTYKRAMENIKKRFPKKYNKLREEVNHILLVRGRPDLIR